MSVTIGFDLRCMQMGHESRGIGMHVRSLLEHLPKTSGFQYVMYAFDSNDPIKALHVDMAAPYTLVQTPALKKSIDSPKDFLALSKIIWHRFAPLKNSSLDYFIQFDFMLGLPKLPRTKTILFAYDLIPLIFKKEYLPSIRVATKDVKGLFRKTKRAIRSVYYRWRYWLHYQNFDKADLVISISEFTKKSLIEVLGLAAEKIRVAPLAPCLQSKEVQRPIGLAKNIAPFVFYIGGTDSRKRVVDLVKAFELVRKSNTNLSLILAGKEFEDVDKIPNEALKKSVLNSPHRNSIFTLGYITDAEKLWMYSHAEAFVFPTAFEGFGLPIVEAMSSGCPVITYNNSSVPEVSGEAAILVPTGDTIALSKEITRVLDDTNFRNATVEAGFKRSRYYTWQKHTRLLFEAIKALD